MFEKITKKISGVDKSKDAGPDSEVREYLRDNALMEEDPILQDRYAKCAECVYLKEEFKLFGITVKDMTPACGECGCNLNLKIPMMDMECPIGEW